MLYEELENKYKNNAYVRITISGKRVGSSKCVGYCTYQEHSGYLSEELRNEHNCTGKDCRYYIKRDKQRDEKFLSRPFSALARLKTDNADMILQKAKELYSNMEGIAFTNVVMQSISSYSLRYVAITNAYDTNEMECRISKATGMEVTLERVNCDYYEAARIIFGVEIA